MDYSKDELLQCICECMADSLPDTWRSAYMRAQIDGNEIDATYQFIDADRDEEQEFTPQNFIAPMNAAKALKALMAQDGNDWASITVTITSDGNYQVHTQ